MGLQRLKSWHSHRALGIGAAVFILGLVIPKKAFAVDFQELILEGIQYIAFNMARVFGKLTAILFDILVKVSNYNQFVDSTAVNVGWVVVRDIANMFFILILLVIAFGTLFRMQKYHYTQLLRKLIIMAVLVNFSKLITGFFIDIMQVIMMTFVNAYADVAAGNLATALGLHQIFTLDDGARPDVTSFEVMATLVLALAMITITFLAVLVYILMLVGRIIALWILTILAPLAYLFSTFPATQKYSSQWWDKFWKYASIGPMLAFALWLTLTIAASNSAEQLYQAGGVNGVSGDPAFAGSATGITAFLSSVSSSSSILGFILTIMLLIVGLTLAAGGATVGGALAGQLAGNVTRFGARTPGFLARAPFRAGGAAVSRSAIGRFGEMATYGLAGLGSRTPGLRTASLRQRNRIEGARREREKKHIEELKTPARTQSGAIQGMAGANRFQQFFMGREGAARLKAAQKIMPAAIYNRDRDEFQRIMADVEGVRNIPAPGWAAIRTAVGAVDPAHPETDPLQPLLTAETRRWIAQSAPRPVAEQAGYITNGERWRYDRNTDRIVPPGAQQAPAPGGGVPGQAPGGGVAPLADVDRKKFEETHRVVEKDFGGDVGKFYNDARFKLNRDAFMPEDLYRQTSALRPGIEASLRGGEAEGTKAVSGIGRTLRQGATGESTNLALNFADLEKFGYKLGDFAGANLSGAAKTQAIQAIIAHAQSTGSLKDDNVDDFRRALESSSSLRLINKNRVGGSSRQVLRHEQTHDAINDLTDEELGGMWSDLPKERQKEIEQHVRSIWAKGEQMSMRQVQEEYFTQALASHGRSDQIGPLQIQPGEEETAEKLGSFVSFAKQERARLEVDALPTDGLEALWERISENRKGEIAKFIRDDFAQGEKMTENDVKRTFFSEALSAHRGGEAQGPLAFNDDERSLALLLHAATNPAVAAPQTAAARARQAKADSASVDATLRPGYKPPARAINPQQFGGTTMTPRQTPKSSPPIVPPTVVPPPMPTPRPSPEPSRVPPAIDPLEAYTLELAKKDAEEKVRQIKEEDDRRGVPGSQKRYDALRERTARQNLQDPDLMSQYEKAAREHFATQEQPERPQGSQSMASTTSPIRPVVVPPSPTPTPAQRPSSTPPQMTSTRPKTGQPVEPKTVVTAPISPEIEQSITQNVQIQQRSDKLLERMSRRLTELPSSVELRSALAEIKDDALRAAQSASAAQGEIAGLGKEFGRLEKMIDALDSGQAEQRESARSGLTNALRRLVKGSGQNTETNEEPYGPKTA